MDMRLADFIRAEMEPILRDWEGFAKTLFHARHMSRAGLRDHARGMLLEIADDLDSPQTALEQTNKAQGLEPQHPGTSAAEVHGVDRQASGFSIMETISEFRALRASVVSHWTKSYPTTAGEQLEDLTRFHEAIDEAVAESLDHYATVKEKGSRLFGAMLLASPDPIYVLDLEGRFVYVNRATAVLFSMEPEAIIGQSSFDLGFSFASDFQRNLEKVIADQSVYRGDFTHDFSSGLGDRFEYVLAPVMDEDQKIEAIVCILRDVTERVIAEEKVWYNAHHDLLTALPNRLLFLDRLEQEVKHADRGNLSIALLFMDLDGFKEINDSLGHEAGDRILSDVATRMSDCVRDADTVARLGGDEFTVIFSGAKRRKDVEVMANSIVDAIAKPFQVAEQRVHISVSIGVAFYPQDESSSAALIKAADQAMYQAKVSGRHKVVFKSLP